MIARSSLAVVVTADDFGIGLKTSEGIIQAHLRGPVTATSLMTITEDHARASIPLLENAPNLDVGLHIVLTRCGHRPLVAGKSSGLVGRDGEFHSNGRLWMQAFFGKLSKAAVAEEIAAQAEIFRKLVGREPTHVDSHHHSHELPTIRDALAEVMETGALPKVTRKTIEPPGILRSVPGVRPKRFAARFIGEHAGELFSSRHIWTNDFFIGMLAPHDLKNEFPWAAFLNHLPQTGVVEWIVHPGLPDETLAGRDDYRAQRTRELEALTKPPSTSTWDRFRSNLSRKSILRRSPAPQAQSEN